MKIAENRYGKASVRVARKNGCDFHEMTVAIALEGDFHSSYRDGDNSLVLPTDTMKNTVYALATDPAVDEPESFARLLARHFLRNLSHLERVKIEVQSHLWTRHGETSFTAGPPHRRVAKLDASRGSESLESGVTGYVVLKTTGSAFEGFLRDELTTLPEAADRILATSLDALWKGEANWDEVMKTMTDTFAGHQSKSVQHTLHEIGEAVFLRFPGIERIHLTMPNKHYLPTKHADVFIPTDGPHGLIEAVLTR